MRDCQLITLIPISKSDAIVPALVKTRLGLQGRFYRLNAPDSVIDGFLTSLNEAGQATVDVSESIDKMFAEVGERMGARWSQYFPRTDLSRALEKLLVDSGYNVHYREGRSERGSDLILEFKNAFIKEPILVGI